MRTEHDIAAVNSMVKSGEIKSYIEWYERHFDKKIEKIAGSLRDNMKDTRVAFIAGPSSSGKTTFTLKLESVMDKMGLDAWTISLDDFYLPREKTPKKADGTYDFETVDALDLELLGKNFTELFKKGATNMPLFDFTKGEPSPDKKHVELKSDSFFLVEGMHALNNRIDERLGDIRSTRIYISLLSDLTLDGATFADKRTLRLMRRMVRDFKFRNATAEQTLSMWDGVLWGDVHYVKPFENRADIVIDSFFPYEAGVIRPYVSQMLSGIGSESVYCEKCGEILAMLEKVEPIDEELVPVTSLSREFFGYSIYY